MSTTHDLSRFLQKQPHIFLAKFLPISIYRKYLSLVGFYYYGIHHEERKNVSKSLTYVLGGNLSKTCLNIVLLRTYCGIFDHYYEKMVNAHRPLPEMMQYLDNRISFSGSALMDQMLSQKKGCILVTGHFGAVEYIPLYLAIRQYRPSIIVRFKTEELRKALVRKSSAVDLELIDADRPSVILKALNAVKRGRVLITLCDEVHSWRPCKRERVQLFGHLIPKDRTLDLLYRRSKAPLCFGVIQRRRTGYHLSLQPLLTNGRENRSVCEASWNLLEKFVWRNPEQWYQWPTFYSELETYILDRRGYDH